MDSLRVAASAALDYGLESIELGPERSGSPPPILLAQARMAARSGVSLETVLRRYFAGHMLLSDFLISEADRRPRIDKDSVRKALRALATLLDRLIAVVSEEYEREASETLTSSPEQRRAVLVQKLLAGELLDASEVAYAMEAFHVGFVAVGSGAAETIRAIARHTGRRLLLVSRGEGGVWAWLGGRRPLSPSDLKRHAQQEERDDLRLTFGEPCFGLKGWRLTHRQAQAALPVALRGPERVLRYSDVAVAASLLGDEVLAESLHQLYLSPLQADRDGGKVWRETLDAYFGSDRRITSTAAAMKLTRQTVRRRLSRIEEQLGQPLQQCTLELELALCLEKLLSSKPAAGTQTSGYATGNAK